MTGGPPTGHALGPIFDLRHQVERAVLGTRELGSGLVSCWLFIFGYCMALHMIVGLSSALAERGVRFQEGAVLRKIVAYVCC